MVGTTPLRGRDGQLETVLARLARLRSGIGSVVVIEGGPGFGKTRLLREAFAAAIDSAIASQQYAPRVPPIVATSHRAAVQLSYAQERMWLIQSLDPENTAWIRCPAVPVKVNFAFCPPAVLTVCAGPSTAIGCTMSAGTEDTCKVSDPVAAGNGSTRNV